jgi:RND family efflux transporter MFP subunit
MKILLKIIAPILVISISIAVALYMVSSRPPVETRILEDTLPVVRSLIVNPEIVQLRVHTQGTVAPRTQISLSSEIPGKIIYVAPFFNKGGFFEKGDVFLRLDPGDYELALVRAKAVVAQARLRIQQEETESKLALLEWEALVGEGSPSSLLRREPQLAEAKAFLESSEAELKQAQRNLERTIIKAPFAGRVRQKSVDIGQFVGAGTPLAVIYSVDFAEIRLPLPDDELAFLDLPLSYGGSSLKVSQSPVTIRARFGGADFSWSGKIVRTEAEIDPRTRVVYAVAQVKDPYARGQNPNRPPLTVGLFVNVELHGRTVENIFRMPRSALRDDEKVAVIDVENRIRLRTVNILKVEGESVLIKEGLKEGEKISLSNVENLTEGMTVEVYVESEPSIDKKEMQGAL